MLYAILMVLGVGSVVLALLVMVQAISLQDLFSFTRRGLLTLVVLLIAGCLLKQLVAGVIIPVLLPVAAGSLAWSLGALIAVIALFFIIRLFVVVHDSSHNA